MPNNNVAQVNVNQEALENKRRQARLRAALEENWRAQGNAGINSPMAVGPNAYNPSPQTSLNQALGQSSIPGGNLATLMDAQKNKARNDAYYKNLGELNTREDTLRMAREVARRNNPAPRPDPLSDIEARLMALASKPDIPGHWESAYSQDYLNQLGGRLTGAGAAAQQQFADAKNEIGANYQTGIDQRAAMQGGLVNALQGAGQNIGVDYAASQQGQQAANDMAYLSQVAELNKANDLSTNDRLGLSAMQFGQNLGSQAREGLLTPKQWIDAQSGLTAGDRLMADFLMNKYNRELDAKDLAAKLAADKQSNAALMGGFTDFARSLTNTADQDQLQNYPDLVQGLAGIQDRRTADEASRIWDITGDPAAAVNYLQTTFKTEDMPDLFKTLTPPTWMPGGGNIQQEQNRLRNYQTTLANYNDDVAQQKQNQAMWQYLLDFFNRYNPNRTAVTTKNSMSNSSSEKLSS